MPVETKWEGKERDQRYWNNIGMVEQVIEYSDKVFIRCLTSDLERARKFESLAIVITVCSCGLDSRVERNINLKCRCNLEMT